MKQGCRGRSSRGTSVVYVVAHARRSVERASLGRSRSPLPRFSRREDGQEEGRSFVSFLLFQPSRQDWAGRRGRAPGENIRWVSLETPGRPRTPGIGLEARTDPSKGGLFCKLLTGSVSGSRTGEEKVGSSLTHTRPEEEELAGCKGGKFKSRADESGFFRDLTSPRARNGADPVLVWIAFRA